MDQEDACHASVGLGLRSFHRALREWVETLVRLQVGLEWEQWCSTVREETFRPFESYDVPGLLDVVLCPRGWDQVFQHVVDRDTRSLLFDVRRHRNRWAHEAQLTLQQTYRALDVMLELRLLFAAD